MPELCVDCDVLYKLSRYTNNFYGNASCQMKTIFPGNMVVIAMFASFDKKAEVGPLYNTTALCTYLAFYRIFEPFRKCSSL